MFFDAIRKYINYRNHHIFVSNCHSELAQYIEILKNSKDVKQNHIDFWKTKTKEAVIEKRKRVRLSSRLNEISPKHFNLLEKKLKHIQNVSENIEDYI